MGEQRRARPARGKDPFLVFGSPKTEEAEIAKVVAAMHSGWLGTGPRVPRFERDFAADKGLPHAVAFNRRTVSLPLSPKLDDDDVADVIDAVRSERGG